jgi:hypothetical protein
MKQKQILILSILLFLSVTNLNAQFFQNLKEPIAPGQRSAISSVFIGTLPISKVSISIVYSEDSIEVVNAFDINKRNNKKYFETKATTIGEVSNGRVNATVIFPYYGKNYNSTKEKIFKPGTKVFYSWARTHTPDGANEELTITNGKILNFIMPRPLTIALMGDSYASGEGAKGDGWIEDVCHRSKYSGGELALKKLKIERNDIEFDYINVTCSGAKLTDFYQNSQLKDDQNPSKGTKQGLQVDLVDKWLEMKKYPVLDILMADGGGNDLGFGDVVTKGLTSVFSEFKNDKDLLPNVRNSLDRLPDNYFLFKTYLESKISVGKIIWFNYPNPITGNPLASGGIDANLCKPGIISSKRLCWTVENNLNENDWVFIYNNFFIPLNQAVATAASTHGWDFVDVSNEAIRKGICNCDGYINSFSESLVSQQDPFGTMHPNLNGYKSIYQVKLFNQLDQSINNYYTNYIRSERSDIKKIAIEIAKAKARAQSEFITAKNSKLSLVLSTQKNLLMNLSKHLDKLDENKIDPQILQKIKNLKRL